ncbi:hypothetical protein ABPG77_008627 [Micractinium sp. CCAP 211/92]
MALDMPERKKTSLAERGTKLLALQLRLLSVLQCLAGAGYITVAVFLQFPPGDPLTLGLWVIGCLAIVTSVFGLIGGCCRFRCCLGVYVVLAVLATLSQTGLLLYLFIAPGDAEETIASYQRARDGINDNLHEIINIGRWVLLGLLCAQVLAIGLASCLRCCSKGRSYEEFQEEEEAEYDARRAAAAEQLDALKAKLGLTAATQGGEGGAPGRSKRVISLTAVSGSAAERQLREQQRQYTMRSSLFDRSEAAEAVEHSRLEADLEAGTISTRVSAADLADVPVDNPFGAAAQPSPSAWPSASTPSPQRKFKPSWSRAGKQ